MTYKEAISLFKLRYKRLAFGGKLPELSDQEIFAEMTVVQASLQNKFTLTSIDSQDMATPKITLIVGQDKYVAGSTQNSLPNDILQIWEVRLNDSTESTIDLVGSKILRNMTKVSGKPTCAALYKNNSQMVMEFDTYPDSAYICHLLYSPRYEIFYGDGGSNTNPIFTDYVAGTLSGVWELPIQWHEIIVLGALANTTQNPVWQAAYTSAVSQLLTEQPVHSGYEIPYDDGIVSSANIRRVYIPGTDLPRY